ncbi:hypothetical protein GJ496_005724 [Pomphorhynchus laevis]|nr:hypothetical protein GJ496_005724 [Pomphorhynchus laevis]
MVVKTADIFPCFSLYTKCFNISSTIESACYVNADRVRINLASTKHTYTLVRERNHASEGFEVSRGERQGSALETMLFNVVINKILHIAYSRDNDGVLIGDSEVRVSDLRYADDIVLLAENLLSNGNRDCAYCEICLIFRPHIKSLEIPDYVRKLYSAENLPGWFRLGLHRCAQLSWMFRNNEWGFRIAYKLENYERK